MEQTYPHSVQSTANKLSVLALPPAVLLCPWKYIRVMALNKQTQEVKGTEDQHGLNRGSLGCVVISFLESELKPT